MPTNPNMVAIQTVTVGSGGAANIEFTSIPQTYTDLVVKCSFRDGVSAVWHNIQTTFNGSATGYSSRLLFQYDGNVGSDVGATTWLQGVYACGATATSSTFSNIDLYIPNYTSSNNKSVSIDSVTENNGTSVILLMSAGLWSNSSAITSIKFTPADSANFAQFSTATLYGVTKYT